MAKLTPAQQKARAAEEQSRSRSRAAEAVAEARAKSKAKPTAPGKGVSRPTTPVPGGVTAPPGGTPAPPAKPDPVNPFLSSSDFDAINAFYTDLNTKLTTIKAQVGTFDPATGTWSGGTEEADTNFQVAQTDKAAKDNTGAAQDDAVARGIFQSSIKDATLYDIEAQRSLSDKFLNDKLTADRLAAGTQMQVLANSKSEFDKNYGSVDASGNPIFGRHAFENAQGVNDANNSAWATAFAQYQADHPGAANTTGAAVPPGPPTKGVARPLTTPPAPGKGSGPSSVTAVKQSPSVAHAAAQAFSKRKKKFYG